MDRPRVPATATLPPPGPASRTGPTPGEAGPDRRSGPEPRRPAGGASPAWDRLTALGPRVVDAGLLLGVGLLVLLDLYTAENSGTTRAFAKVVLSVAALGAVAARRRFPLGAMLSTVGLILLATWGREGFSPGPYSFQYPAFAPVAALGALATPVVRRQPVVAATAATVAGAIGIASLFLYRLADSELILFAVLFGGTYVIGVGAGVYLRDLDRQQRLAADAARTDERMDLARELHDLVAHYVTGIVVQAQAARVVADADPSAAGAALERIEGAGKDALGAMRRLVGSLRNDDAAPVAPPVGLAGLHDLVATSSTLGLVVDLHVDPEAAERVPGSVAASAHRIVQESLTNVRRHASGATRATVDVALVERALVVTVADDGRPPVGGHRGDRTGYGLVGMHERAQALGGTLTAGPADPPAHGWLVRARLPLDAPAAGTFR